MSEEQKVNGAEPEAAEACGVCLPPWRMPNPLPPSRGLLNFMRRYTPLKIKNSLTRSKTPFIPLDPSGRRVLWYQCGPTVYDKSHMGHASTYVRFDAMRRIMEDYFNYDVVMCMNITDIDDKIIKRSKEKGVPFRELAAEHEMGFLDDMRRLNVKEPTVLTRVSECVPEIIDYVQRIIDNGMAYESNGSVYFDTQRFRSTCGHAYPKMKPEMAGNSEALAEGEGVLTDVSKGAQDKRSASDFALWKRVPEAPPGQVRDPHWESPWGEGRPGWHIECSVMSSSALGGLGDGRIDIHSGGVDLVFPHHDNEMAQSEAYYGCNQWVNYFVHSGHLHIKGFKMSKSLKNFITIQAALEEQSPRQLRLLFLKHRYNQPMDYGDATMQGVLDMEKTFVQFFHNVKAALRSLPQAGKQFWRQKELAFAGELCSTKQQVHEALCDDFDTPTVLQILLKLVRLTNIYVGTTEPDPPVPLIVKEAAQYLTRIFRVFGLVEGDTDIGFGEQEAGGASREEVLGPVLDTLTAFREKVRTAALAGDVQEVLRVCDVLRDRDLIEVGVRLEDGGAGATGSRWKLDDPETLKRELEQREQERLRREEEKRRQREEKARREAEKAAKARISPADLFRSDVDDDGSPKWGSFGDDGLPLTLANGDAVSKGQTKKLKKLQAAQEKLHAKYLAEKGTAGE